MVNKKRILYVVYSIIILIVLMIGFIGYLQLNLFVVKPIRKDAMETYISELKAHSFEHEMGNTYQVFIPMETLNQAVTQKFIEEENLANRTVVSAEFDLVNKSAKVNYRRGSLYIPVYCKVVIKEDADGPLISVIPLSFGKLQLDLPAFIDNLIYSDIFLEPIDIKLKSIDYKNSLYFTYLYCHITDEGLACSFDFELPYFSDIMADIEQGLDADYMTVYAKGSDSQKEAQLWIDQYNETIDDIISAVFEDYRSGGNVIKDLLTLVHPTLLNEIYVKYPMIESLAPRQEIAKNRSLLIGNAVLGYGQKLLTAFETLEKEHTIVNNRNQPFNLTTMKNITVQTLVDLYKLDFSDQLMSQLELSYYNGIITIIYTTVDNQYLILNKDKFIPISVEDYQDAYHQEALPEGTLTNDVATFEQLYFSLFDYYQEDVFIRYLKDDGDESFAIVSRFSDYQNYKIVLLKKIREKFIVLSDTVTSLDEILKDYPDFNLNLVSRIFENVTPLKLNAPTIASVFAGLVERGYVDDNEALIYCSYDGNKYISIVLNSGEKYIYTLYRSTFLENVYPLKEALETFKDIPQLILLQESPEQEVN